VSLEQYPPGPDRREAFDLGPSPIRPGQPLPQWRGTIGPLPTQRLRLRKSRLWLHILLFVLTVVTTTMMVGPVYSACLMSILTAHEFGHYFAARYHRVDASLPYFIPGPFLFGTMGAVIRMSPYMPNRRALFDIASAGPLAGMALAVPISFVGILLPEHVLIVESQAEILFGSPILFQLFERLLFGVEAVGVSSSLNEVAFAGWVGLFVTALNLLPIGQLDGGHISYAVFGRKSWLFARVAFGGLLLITLTMSRNYSLFLVLLLVFGIKHPPTMNDTIPLDPVRRKIAWLLVVTFILCFTPVPLKLDFAELTDQPSTEKATNSSPDTDLPLPPPAAITTNCLPSASYVHGVANPAALSSVSHSTSPVSWSNARIFLSKVPAIKTNSPAVAIVPPCDGVPVFGIPLAVSSGNSPLTTRQANFPLSRSTAVTYPHGGLNAGYDSKSVNSLRSGRA